MFWGTCWGTSCLGTSCTGASCQGSWGVHWGGQRGDYPAAAEGTRSLFQRDFGRKRRMGLVGGKINQYHAALTGPEL